MRKKLRLDLNELAVETFDTREAGAPKPGTVRGAESEQVDSEDKTCVTCPSDCGSCEWDSCNDTCTCPYTFDGHLVDTHRSCVVACPVCWI